MSNTVPPAVSHRGYLQVGLVGDYVMDLCGGDTHCNRLSGFRPNFPPDLMVARFLQTHGAEMRHECHTTRRRQILLTSRDTATSGGPSRTSTDTKFVLGLAPAP